MLAEVVAESPDLVVFCGDLTLGSLPQETLALVRALELPARFVRGNADRSVGMELEGRGPWMDSTHTPEDVAFLASFEPTVTVDVDGMGATCFSHGSPRSDIECVTERTPAARVRELMEGRTERAVVTGHVHVQYDRVVDGIRLLSLGSVGLPYEGEPGAYWALLGPDLVTDRHKIHNVDPRVTQYDVEGAAALMRATADLRVDQIVELMLEPPPRDEAIEHAEGLVFSE